MNESRFSSLLANSYFGNPPRDRVSNFNVVIEHKVVEAQQLAHEFNEMIESVGGNQNETFLNFTQFIKDRRDHIKNLSMEIKDAMPSVYPKFFIEACEQLKVSLSNELEEIKIMNAAKKMEIVGMKKLDECLSARIEAIEELMNLDITRGDEEETIDAIERKILDLDFKEAQKDLDFTLKNIFPDNHVAFAEVMTKVCDEEVEEDDDDRWIDLKDEDTDSVYNLLIANIIKRNKKQPSEFCTLKN